MSFGCLAPAARSCSTGGAAGIAQARCPPEPSCSSRASLSEGCSPLAADFWEAPQSYPCNHPWRHDMAKFRFTITMSVDGYVAGPRQSLENPLGEGGVALHDWAFATRSFRATHGGDGGETGLDDDHA